MISLEQVRLLESKVTRAIEYVKKVTEENSSLKGKLDSYQKRIDELEVLIKQFREEQSRIEEAVLSALDRLNQFEDAVESKLSTESKLSVEKLSKTHASAEVSVQVTTEIPAPTPPEVPAAELDIF